MRIIIATPPFFVLTSPAAAPAVLAAVLREAGFEAIPFDINRFCIDRLLTADSLRASIRRFPTGQDPADCGGYASKALPEIIERSVGELRSEECYRRFESYSRARLDVELAMRTHARAYGRSRWSSIEYRGDHDPTDPYDLLAAVRRGGELFDGPLDEAVRYLLDFRPDMVALSVSVPAQLYAALRLAVLIRRYAPGVHVCVGGATITRLRRAYPHLPELFDLVDSVILREGELPLVALARALAVGGDPVYHVGGMVARRNGSVILTGSEDSGLELLGTPERRKQTLNLGNMPFPVFDDLVPGPYLSPGPMLPVSTTRNCYYNKCEFCDICRSFSPGYDEMSATRVAEQMRHLGGQFPGALFKDVSEALPPKLIFDVTDILARQDEPPAWEAFLRFEGPFASGAAARQLRRGGLRIAYLGLETASPRLAAGMKKHIDIDQAEQTIRHFAEAGIWVHLFLMSGYARETEFDHQATLNFLDRNTPFIRSIQAAPFGMALDSDIVAMASRYHFTPRQRQEPSFSLTVDLDRFGDIPLPDVTQRRVREIRQVAYEGSRDRNPVLAASRYLWDAHKLFFLDRGAEPRLPAPQEQERGTVQDASLLGLSPLTGGVSYIGS
jgi:hypothetical protein